jgi:hypothetical protein
MELYSVGDAARRLGADPKDISRLFYRGLLSHRTCPKVAGHHVIPESYLPVIRLALQGLGKRVAKESRAEMAERLAKQAEVSHVGK